MGADKIEEGLRPLLRAVADAGHPVVWACDPMHGNTFTAPSGRKTRHFDDIVREISGFVRAHRAEGTWPGGIHVELTGETSPSVWVAATSCSIPTSTAGTRPCAIHDSTPDRASTWRSASPN